VVAGFSRTPHAMRVAIVNDVWAADLDSPDALLSR